MSTLLMRLAGPLQSWGVASKFNHRGTEKTPTKSGVTGLVAAALGRRRGDPIDDLTSLKFGVRIEREGILLKDFHTAFEEDFWKNRDGKYAHVTTRFYLADALFLAGFEGNLSLLESIEYALRHPTFPLFLGRRSCPPEGLISLGIRKSIDLEQALEDEPPLCGATWRPQKEGYHQRIMIDASEKDDHFFYQRDHPVSYDALHRKYEFRVVTEYSISNHSNRESSPIESTAHDPFVDLQEE